MGVARMLVTSSVGSPVLRPLVPTTKTSPQGHQAHVDASRSGRMRVQATMSMAGDVARVDVAAGCVTNIRMPGSKMTLTSLHPPDGVQFNGEYVLNSDDSFEYTPPAGFEGEDVLVY